MGKIDENKAAAGEGVKAVSISASASLVDEIGTLTYPKAVKFFGKDQATTVMKRVAEICGHGSFEDAELMAPLFGGLAMPSPDKIAAPKKEGIYDTLPEGEFYFQAALEDYAAAKEAANAARRTLETYFANTKR